MIFIKTLDNIEPADDVETTVGEILRNTIKHQMSSYEEVIGCLMKEIINQQRNYGCCY